MLVLINCSPSDPDVVQRFAAATEGHPLISSIRDFGPIAEDDDEQVLILPDADPALMPTAEVLHELEATHGSVITRTTSSLLPGT